MIIPKTYKVTAENAMEIREAMKKKESAQYYRKLLEGTLRDEDKSNAEPAEITEYHPKRVSQLVCLYCNKGLAALISDGRKGGNNRNMSEEEACTFLSQFDDTNAI